MTANTLQRVWDLLHTIPENVQNVLNKHVCLPPDRHPDRQKFVAVEVRPAKVRSRRGPSSRPDAVDD